jgi:hypothetical protein
VHGCTVEGSRRHGIETKTIADRRRLCGTALLFVMGGKDLDRFLFGPGDGNGDTVEHQTPRGRDCGSTEAFVAGAGNPFTQTRCNRHWLARKGRLWNSG